MEDMAFILSSSVCFYSAMTYKFVIKQSTRSTHIKLLSILLPVLKTLTILAIIYYAFFKADEFLNLLFLLLLTFLVMWILFDKNAFYNYTSHKSAYMWYTKWILFCFILFTHSMKSVYFQVKTESTISVNLDYFFSTLNRENLMSLEYVFFIAASYLYLRNVLKGAQMEFFDAGLFGEMGKLYHYKSIWQKGDDIGKDSLTSTYFSRQLLRVMNINEEDAFNKAARFKYRYMRKLFDSSKHISSKMEKIRDSYITKLPKRKRIMVLFFMFTKWLKGLVLLALKRESLTIFLLFINFFCCFFFLFYT